ncbi:MAG TPA: hypothetical protein DCG57_06455 [Candidatus Riflebacteria bacterium]|nr:hypothetical protein [Candidatus Riflebacteria bacterium]
MVSTLSVFKSFKDVRKKIVGRKVLLVDDNVFVQKFNLDLLAKKCPASHRSAEKKISKTLEGTLRLCTSRCDNTISQQIFSAC